MSNCEVESRTHSLDSCVSPNNQLIPESDFCYAEGDSLEGGPCGEWLMFQVHLRNKCWPGTIRLHLESCDEYCFRTTVHVGSFADERDKCRAISSCVNDRLMNNLYAESIYKNFEWDVCVSDDNTYNVRYKVSMKGMFLLYVKLDGNDIAGSPFNIFISDGKTCSLSTRVQNINNLKCRAMPDIKSMVEVMDDERWDFECKNKVPEDYQKRRLSTVDKLRKYSLVNEITLNVCDKVGNIIKYKTPYVKAWCTNLGKVIDVKHLGNGVISIKYVVIVPRPDLDKVKTFYSNKNETVLPSYLRNLGTPCCLNVQLDGESIYGSPFVPEITNVMELEEYYASFPETLDSLSLSLNHMLSQDNLEGCSQAIFNFFHVNKDMDDSEKSKAFELISKLLDDKSKHLKKNNFLMESQMYKMNHLKNYGLGQLHQFVDSQYQKMLKAKTSSIIECIKELNSYNSSVNGETKGFKNLADVIFNYTRIGDELRKLHRYDLADKFDSISDRICEEIELNRWENLLHDKKKKMLKIKEQVDESVKKLEDFKKKVHEKYDNLEFKPIKKMQLDKGTQTIQQETVTGRLLPFVKNRCIPEEPKTEVDKIVETFWRRCSNYDIHSGITKVLKSSIRLKNALNEIFFHYSNKYNTKDNMIQYGIPRNSMDLFHMDLSISKTLLNNREKLDEMFDKFSIMISGKRVLPENMWCVYLRELAYMNLLYKIAESGDVILLRDNLHPSRLSAFHHFCQFHILTLYEKLFTTRPEFQKSLKFYNTKKLLRSSLNFKYAKESAQMHYFPTETDLANYITTEIPNTVGNKLNENILHLIFKHYSRLSMFGKQKQDPKSYNPDDDSWLSTAMFVVFSRDFGIVPGYMDGSSVQKIADDTIIANIEQNTYQSTTFRGRLFYKDFVDALVNIISNSIYKICLNRHEMYTKHLKDNSILNITKKNKFHETRNCIQTQESVLEEVDEVLQILGLNNPLHIELTIEAIYGSEALEYLH
ncbi:Filamin/ABP280 repeat family protein [Theileria parva strain Muguga]|uniref:Uncharacterized protein n=1 Tax=Theileria parva TaxID=5875 RepID=Q4N7S9_THEPA|nr:Filamin/ABP280 repeat family protein [Theileria parva strain Muguga]EAN33979.1 Filamin/ABP280 repeat family protein [Theileria parva strain Muguga]|eukprot:XP_766262.1 hypothetical protein [Theileria parva strain Muguga]